MLQTDRMDTFHVLIRSLKNLRRTRQRGAHMTCGPGEVNPARTFFLILFSKTGPSADHSAFCMAFRYMEFFGFEKTRSTIGSKNSSGSLS